MFSAGPIAARFACPPRKVRPPSAARPHPTRPSTGLAAPTGKHVGRKDVRPSCPEDQPDPVPTLAGVRCPDVYTAAKIDQWFGGERLSSEKKVGRPSDSPARSRTDPLHRPTRPSPWLAAPTGKHVGCKDDRPSCPEDQPDPDPILAGVRCPDVYMAAKIDQGCGGERLSSEKKVGRPSVGRPIEDRLTSPSDPTLAGARCPDK
jgi:hypothetical protein